VLAQAREVAFLTDAGYFSSINPPTGDSMKRTSIALRWLLLLGIPIAVAPAQDRDQFDVQAYIRFLAAHQDMSKEQLLSMHPAGTFQASVAGQLTGIPYFSRIDSFYKFTPYELELLAKHGFVVSERMPAPSITGVYSAAWQKDLPAFVSTDAIVHAFHKSYDNILISVELEVLVNSLDSLLACLHEGVPLLNARYGALPGMSVPLRDLDFYLATARQLLKRGGTPVFSENISRVSAILQYIAAQSPQTVALFGSERRSIDFSQFTPRGHYAEHPTLTAYFKAMIWLGRTEVYLSPPEQDGGGFDTTSIQQQTIMAALCLESAAATGAQKHYDRIERILKFFVGDQDNVSFGQLTSELAEQGITSAADLLPVGAWSAFHDKLMQKPYAGQRIISQLLGSNPYDAAQIKPASAFLLVGQRFVVDSYVTGNVVYDRILFQGSKIRRMLPSTLDVLFALGNDAAAQLLQPGLEQYHYASNLAALRYLVDGYGRSFWDSTLYNGWLDALRSLNPPAQRDSLPAFMQTAAWWQEKMNTQLAGWAQLRHDNLLYAKQSYSGIVTCSFPESYVEPIPAFYDAMKRIAHNGREFFGSADMQTMTSERNYFAKMESILDTLGTIARKELSSTPLEPAEKNFLACMLYSTPAGCGTTLAGWYIRLYYMAAGWDAEDLVVADVHTAPTDEAGNMVGWVLHSGTGPVNIGVFLVALPDGQRIACVGPALSYYEYVSVNFKRLTDQEWSSQYALASAFRPDFVNCYLANATGGSRGSGSMLTMQDPSSVRPPAEVPAGFALLQNHPNPFNSTTMISLTVPAASREEQIELKVYDIQGRCVKTLLNTALPAGKFLVRWNGTNDLGAPVATGTYLYTARTSGWSETKKLVVLR
jgi:hypothetical protein